MRVIYIDILFFINFYTTYFLLIGTCCITHQKIKIFKRISGSIIGAVSSFVIFLPQLPAIVNIAGKILICMLIVLSSFGFATLKSFIKNTAIFFLINCIYAGIMLCLWLFSAPMGMIYNNMTSYFNIPLWLILTATATSYIILDIIRRLLDSKTIFDKKYTIHIFTEKGEKQLSAMADSGNKLTDYITGLPIIFCDINKCSELCPDAVIQYLTGSSNNIMTAKGIRIIPCSTVAGNSMAICFKPDKIILSDEKKEKEITALIGFTKKGLKNTDVGAIFNPNLFNI